MSKKTIVVITDDIDGGKADESLVFGVNDDAWEIDLNDRNASLLRTLLQPFMEAGRKLVKPARKGRPAGARTGGAPMEDAHGRKITAIPRAQREAYLQRQAIRDWARSVGIDVPRNGVIAADIVRRYEKEAGAIPVQSSPTPPPPEADVRPRVNITFPPGYSPNPFSTTE